MWQSGDLETALECTQALSQLKEDVLEVHNILHLDTSVPLYDVGP